MRINSRLAAFAAAALTLSLCACAEKNTAVIPTVSGEFCTTVLDTGKSDAIILNTENHCVVIDCGEKGDGKDILSFLSENNIESVDYLFITHFDKDHVGGAAKVINGISIKNIVTPDYVGSNDEYKSFIKAAQKNEISPINLTEDMSFTLDDCSFSVYPPQKSSYSEPDNDFSLVISVKHGENSFLFAGDCESQRLRELKGQLDLKHSFLKVPHHGRTDPESETFFKEVSPEYAVITCSEKQYADTEVLDSLDRLGAKVYLTTLGTVTAVSNGRTIEIRQ
jgi:beta-lactamase superfamily II metal-dependent hydrolase